MSYEFFSAQFLLHHVVLHQPWISFDLGPPATPPEFKNSSHPDGKEPMLVKGPISWSWSGHLQQRIKVASGIWRLQAGGNIDVLPHISTRCLIPHENWYVQCSASSTSCTEQLWDLKLWNEALQSNGDRWRPYACVTHLRFMTMNFCSFPVPNLMKCNVQAWSDEEIKKPKQLPFLSHPLSHWLPTIPKNHSWTVMPPKVAQPT